MIMAANDDIEDIEEIWDDEEGPVPEEEGTGEKTISLQLTVDKRQEPLRIDKFLMNRIEGATRNKIQQAIDNEYILINGNAIKANYKIRPGDDIVVYSSRKVETTELIAEEMPLDIVHEDDDVMIVNKPPGIVVHPGCGNYHGTLVNGLAYYLQAEDAETAGLPRVGLVHRIDKDTSGLLVIAKTEKAMSDLAAQFKKHTVHRRYIALVWGDVAEEEGTVIAHIGRHQRLRKIMDAYPEGEHGKEAITHYRVLQRFNYVTLIELRLETGRTHQIRVHMKHIGHPLFNDHTYGGNHIVKGTVFTKYKQFVDNCFKILPRQALHAKELGFTHPTTREWVQYDSPLPAEITEVIEKWATYTSGMTSQLKKKLDNL